MLSSPDAEAHLFSPITLRGTTFANRVWVSPMCEYSAVDGVPQDWHLVHLGSLARGGAGLVMSEATAVTPNGRISPADTGIWNNEQVAAWRRITDFIRTQETIPGIQLAHAGRKASTSPPWLGRGYVEPADGGWADTVAPSAIPFADLPAPAELTLAEIAAVVEAFRAAAARALEARFEVVEIHAAHGYLLHEFLSPLSNPRTDAYGGSFDDRIRVLLEVVDAVRDVWPDDQPLLVRLSSTDWADGGWDGDDTVRAGQAPRRARRRPDRLLERRHRPAGGDPDRAGLPGAVRGEGPPRGGYAVGRSRHDHRARTGRGDHLRRRRRRRTAGAGTPSRTALATTRGP